MKQYTTPVYLFEDTTALTRRLFSQTLSDLTRELPESHLYSPHSFRIGAATAAASNHVPSEAIKFAGRWRSDVFSNYIRLQKPSQGINLYP